MSGKAVSEKFETVRDGMTIRGLYYRPEGDHLPIAVVSHGFMANYKTTKKYAEWFARRGYASFCFDFNGGGVGGKSDKDTTKMTVFTEVEDLKAVLAYAVSLPETDETRIDLMGCSQGGVVSALLAAEEPESIERLVLFYPALCLPEDARAGKMLVAKFDPDNVPETIRCGPMKLGREYVTSVQHINLIKRISAYNGPVLIVQGTGDKIVHYRYAQRAAKAYPNAELELIPDGKHNFSNKDDRTALHYVDAFIRKKAEKIEPPAESEEPGPEEVEETEEVGETEEVEETGEVEETEE